MFRNLLLIKLFLSFLQYCSTEFEAKIAEGEKCDVKKYPFMVNIIDNSNRGPIKHRCGGTLLSRKWVLSAGQCMIYCSKKDNVDHEKFLYAKVNNKKYLIRSCKIHPQFKEEVVKESLMQNDIGIYELKEKVHRSVPFVRLPKGPENDSSLELRCSYATIMGWGTTSLEWSQGASRHLMCGNVKVVKYAHCAKNYSKSDKELYNLSKVPYIFCASANKSDACEGDAGGPLLCKGVQYGIFSWTLKCGEYPGIYTQVDKYLDFIEKTINKSHTRTSGFNLLVISTIFCSINFFT